MEIEEKINELKSKEFERLITPCSVFMTFETEEGVNRALDMDRQITANPDKLGHLRTWLRNHEIEIQAASEPSDIIWENRHFTPWDRRKKECIVWSVLTLMLLVSFVIIFMFTTISNNLINKYPYVDCTSLVGHDNAAVMEKQAILEFQSNTALEEQGKDVSYKGYVQCFCDDKQAGGAEPDATYGSEDTPVCEAYHAAYLPT